MRSFLRFTIFAAALGILCSAAKLHAQDMPVPAKIQVAIFKKIFPMNASISGGAKVLVAYAGASSGIKDDIVKQFADAGIEAKAVEAGAVSGAIEGYNVVYIAPGATSAKGVCASKKVLSVSGVPEYAEGGDCSIAIGTEGGKPKIIVNAGRAKTEDQKLSSQLLGLAKVVQ